MDDLVQRLRALRVIDEVGSDNRLGDEAADMIEALMRARQALKKFETMVRDDDYDAEELIGEFAEIARKALEDTE